MELGELLDTANGVFWMDRELPEMVFRRTDLSFFATEGLCPLMEPVSTLIGEIARALDPPELQAVCWVNREGGANRVRGDDLYEGGSFGRIALAAGASIYPAWRTLLDDLYHGMPLEFVMFSPGQTWGLWVDNEFEMAVLGVPSNLDAALRAKIGEEFGPSIVDFVDEQMRPLGPSNPRWQADLDQFVDRYGPREN